MKTLLCRWGGRWQINRPHVHSYVWQHAGHDFEFPLKYLKPHSFRWVNRQQNFPLTSLDGYTTLRQTLIGCETLSQDYCKLISWYYKIIRGQLWTLICPKGGGCSSIAMELCYFYLIYNWVMISKWLNHLSVWGQQMLLQAHSESPGVHQGARPKYLALVFNATLSTS